MTNNDDIVFDEMRVREPVRMRRPDRDPKRACLAVCIPRVDDLPIYIDHRPADAIERHALNDTSVELGGILLGKECMDDETGDPFVLITEAIEAKHYENTQASFTYTHESWAEITRERDEKFPDLDIVGWYHTHPDFGIFLSSHDLFIHHHFFDNPLQVAYVVDPVRQVRGFFQWRDGSMAAVRGFFISGDRAERVAISRLANELENLPNTEGGGGLSPRLEAELIAMLSRPSQSVVADRGTASMLFGLFGMIVGALVVVLIFWLSTMSQQIDEQTRQLAKLRTEQPRSTELDEQRLKTKEQVLDTLLADVRVGTDPDAIGKSYLEARQRNEDLERRLEQRNIDNEALSHYARSKVDELNKVQADLDRERLRSEELATKAAAKDNDAILKASAVGPTGNSNLLLWAAIGGWLGFIVSLAALIALWSRKLTPDPLLVAPPASQTIPDPRVRPIDAPERHVIE